MTTVQIYPERLRNERFAQGERRIVDYAPAFCDRSGLVAKGSRAEEDLKTIIKLLGEGSLLPERFYRNLVGDGQDSLLNDFGIKHLHLGGATSDVLLFLVEYDARVMLLEINDHNAFAECPVGSALRRIHNSALIKSDQEAAEERQAGAAVLSEEAKAAKTIDLKARLRPRKGSAF